MDLVIEFFFELYLEIMTEIFPSSKHGSRLIKIFSIVLSVLIPIAAIFSLVIGISLIAENENVALGIILIAIFAAITAAQIIGAVIIHKRNNGD